MSGPSLTTPAASEFATNERPQRAYGYKHLRLVHVLDVGFEDQQIRLAVAIHLEATLVVPLNDALKRLPVLEHDSHLSFGLHLLQIIEVFRIGLVRRGSLLGGRFFAGDSGIFHL